MSPFIARYTIVALILASWNMVAQAQPYNLSSGVGDGSVTVGVDGYGAFGNNATMPDATDAIFDPIGAAGPIVGGSIFESGVALRIGVAGPRAFLCSGTIGGSGGLPKVTVTGSATTGSSSFLDPSGQRPNNQSQTIAATLNGAARTGSVLTQTYTIRNTTAGPLTFELCRCVDTQRNVYFGGQLFAADGTEFLYADESPINPLVVGITGIGGTPLPSNRFEIKNVPTTRTDILTGLALNDAVAGGLPYNVNMGLRNVFTVAAGASTVYITHTVWGNGPAASVLFPNPPAPVSPGPGILYGLTWGDQLIRIDTNPTAGIGLGKLVGPLSSAMKSFGPAFQGNNLYTFDSVAGLVRQLNPANGATLASINVGAIAGNEGELVLRNDGTGFICSTTFGLGNFYSVNLAAPSSSLITGAFPNMDGLAFSSTNVLYGLNQGGTSLFTVDQTTGATTLVGATGIPAGFALGGLAFDAGGVLYASVSASVVPTPSFLYRIDTSTGTASFIGNIGFDGVTGIRFMLGSAAGNGSSNGEGSYPGSGGPGGSEGGFGFGRSKATPSPILLGPIHADGTTYRVHNVSHRMAAAVVVELSDNGDSLEFGLAGGFLLALAAYAAVRYRPSDAAAA